MTQTKFGEVRKTTDFLIVGGGIAGLTAAVAAKEKNPELRVLIVEKQTAGYSGKANKGGGVLQYFDLEHMSPEDFVEYHAHEVGCYLGDQELMKKYVSMNNELLDRLESWGVTIPKKRIPTGPMTYMVGVDLDITLKVRKKAEKLGVEIIDKVTVSDLLTDGSRISGAVGYSILDGTFYILKSSAVLLATGSQNYRIAPMWSSGRGDGIAAAYRAGAEMRNAEFGNFAQLFKKNSFQEVVFGENYMYNARGENVTQNFRRFPEADISSTAIREWYRQMGEGKGPIYLRVPDQGDLMQIWDRPYGVPFWARDHGKAAGRDPECEVVPGFVGEQSPLRVDHHMETTIHGLYGAGDVCYCGSGAPGAVPAPPGRNRGSGILNAVFNGILGGESAADFVAETPRGAVSEEQIAGFRKAVYRPLENPDGVDPKEVINLLQDLLCPVENSIYMSQYRLDLVLRRLEKVKKLAKKMRAEDFHGVLACHEAEAMVLCAEMQFRVASMRKESRGWFLREDYPQMDNDNWLQWIIISNKSGEMTFTTERVPVEQWDVQPYGRKGEVQNGKQSV